MFFALRLLFTWILYTWMPCKSRTIMLLPSWGQAVTRCGDPAWRRTCNRTAPMLEWCDRHIQHLVQKNVTQNSKRLQK